MIEILLQRFLLSLGRFLASVVLVGLGLFVSVDALAQIPASNATSGTYTGLDHINRIIRGTPGVTTTAISGGVDAVASGPVNFNKGGLNIPIPTTVTGKVSASAVALAGARIGLRWLPYVGTAIALKEMTDAVAKEGWKVCAPPAFFCKPDWDNANNKYYWYNPNYGAYRPTALESCTSAVPLWDGTNWNGPFILTPNTYAADGTVQTATCTGIQKSNGQRSSVVGMFYRGTCPTSGPLTNRPEAGCNGVAIPPKPDFVATESDLQAALNKQYATDQALIKKMYDQQKAVEAQNPSLPPIIAPSTIPVALTAPPVSFPATQVLTKTEPNPDGNGTKTTTVNQQVTVTPTLGSSPTLENPKITFPTTTTTTTSVVNNVTNTTNITTEVTKEEPVNQEKPEPLPKDYNREATQLKILEQLDGSTAPAAPADPTIAADMTKGQQDLDKEFTDLPATINDSKSNWFSWVWSPTVGQCHESDYSGSVRGYAVNIGVCELVDKFREVCGFLWAIIGALSIYSQIFKPRSEA